MGKPLSNGHEPDLRSIGIHADFWYPLARSKNLAKGATLGVKFAGDPIVLFRSESGTVFALEDRCAHRQIPLSEGKVCGSRIQCGYHQWTYDGSGKCVDVPYLSGDRSLPNGVRAYPCREAYGLIFVFPGDAGKADTVAFPLIEAPDDPAYKTRTLDREIKCHYSFMHENLMDMNHQFLHRRLMGKIRANLQKFSSGDNWLEAIYTFTRAGGGQSLGERFMVGGASDQEDSPKNDFMRIRTDYPYQRLQFVRAEGTPPVLDLWIAYVPVDREQKINHSIGLMCIKKPALPGLIHLLWPFIVRFTEGIFTEDHHIVELEQQAHDAQGADWNQEIFPVIRGLRDVLLRNGMPMSNGNRPGGAP